MAVPKKRLILPNGVDIDETIAQLQRRIELLRFIRDGAIKPKRVRVRAHDVDAYHVREHYRLISPTRRARVATKKGR